MPYTTEGMGALWLKYRGTRFPIRHGETTLGRSPYCSIVVSNKLVSRQHASIRLERGRLEISDLGSSNGTYVNDEKLQAPQQLVARDVIRLGSDLLEVVPAEKTSRIDTEPEGYVVDDLDGPSVTGVHHATVELVEAMVSSAVEAGSGPGAAPTVCKGIDRIVQGHTSGRSPLTDAQILRLTAAVEHINSWFEEGSFEPWRASTLGALRKS